MLVTAFQETFELEYTDAPLTIANVLRELRSARPVPRERILALRDLVLEARRATERDLAENEPCAELKGLLTAMVEDYQLLTALLRQLADGDPTGTLLGELIAADAQLADSDAALEEWEERCEMRCPACGEAASGADWHCPRHGVYGLYPDPYVQENLGGARLGDHYLEAFSAYQGVLDGTLHFEELEAALTPLEVMLRRFLNLARSEDALGDTTAAALERVVRASTRSLEGTKRIRHTATSRQTRDLHGGWSEVFGQANEIAACIPLIARAFGGAAAAAQRDYNGNSNPSEAIDIDFD